MDALKTRVQALTTSSADAPKLTAVLQKSQSSDDPDDVVGAAIQLPRGASASVAEMLEGFEVEAEPAETRQSETTAPDFELLEQPLADENAEDVEPTKKFLPPTEAQVTTDAADLILTDTSLAEHIDTRNCHARLPGGSLRGAVQRSWRLSMAYHR